MMGRRLLNYRAVWQFARDQYAALTNMMRCLTSLPVSKLSEMNC